MKKIIVIFGFLLFIASIQEANSTPSNKLISSVMDIHGQIQAKQREFNKTYLKDVPMLQEDTKPTAQKPPHSIEPPPPPTGGKPPKRRYIPRVYAIQYASDKEEPKQEVIINNTYNYYNTAPDSKAEENKPKELTQAQKDEMERKELRKQYSYILSNKTMENSKMCSTMAANFSNVSKTELDRLLNRILRLNCDVSKLR